MAGPEFALSTLNWTLATATLSVALAVMVAVPEIVALLPGDVIVTIGGVVSGGVAVKVTTPPLNAAKTAPQLSDAPSKACAELVPAVVVICCSTSSFVPGARGTFSTVENPLPAVKLAELAVEIAPSNKSAPDIVAFPLFGDTPFPCAIAITSSEFVLATPEYSTIAIRIVPDIVSDTLIVFAPPTMFSA